MFSWTEFPRRRGERSTVPLSLSAGSTELALRHYPPTQNLPDDAGGPRPRLLLIHGFRGDHHGMQLIVDALPEYEIFAPDLPGFGETPPLSCGGRRAEHSLGAFAAAVEALADALGLGAADVVAGHSFGSIVVAAHLAGSAPADSAGHRGARRWAAAALLSPLSDDIFRRAQLLPGAAGVELYYRFCGVLPEKWGDRALRSRAALAVTNLSMIVSRAPELKSFIRDQHRRHFGSYADRQTLLEAYRASSRHTVTAYAGALDLPTLLVTGAQDQLSTLAGRRVLCAAVPGAEGSGAQLEVIRGTGHLLHYEKPAQSARALRRFLRQL